MNHYSISEKIIERSFYISVWFIKKINSKSEYKQKLQELESYAEGTLGKEISKCLIENDLSLVPYYESHDLKHVVLNFKMTPIDEIRMQAFMLGNGNISIPSIAIFLYGFILMPKKWKVFWNDFQLGQQAISIKNWSIDEFADKNLQTLRNQIFKPKVEPINSTNNWTIQEISKYGSYSIIIAGILGMLFCFPFLWSSNLADLVGAGFPFLTGAVLIVGGLMNLSILSNKITLEKNILDANK